MYCDSNPNINWCVRRILAYTDTVQCTSFKIFTCPIIHVLLLLLSIIWIDLWLFFFLFWGILTNISILQANWQINEKNNIFNCVRVITSDDRKRFRFPNAKYEYRMTIMIYLYNPPFQCRFYVVISFIRWIANRIFKKKIASLICLYHPYKYKLLISSPLFDM